MFLQRRSVWDQSSLVHCSHCLSFEYVRHLCKDVSDKCAHCDGTPSMPNTSSGSVLTSSDHNAVMFAVHIGGRSSPRPLTARATNTATSWIPTFVHPTSSKTPLVKFQVRRTKICFSFAHTKEHRIRNVVSSRRELCGWEIHLIQGLRKGSSRDANYELQAVLLCSRRRELMGLHLQGQSGNGRKPEGYPTEDPFGTSTILNE
ncbi:hypothetical protein EVAR_24503_1 [Eumeta japonica]|uniref:Uncharacterized protein n=1 Tax=Eumeta variegata TaxID=151549 RepID=A0A4C1UQV9_EUMVA|nr:hypothetical protein EVAR_24503_1 [Eumeta japonica]